jgi:hypothetical protein
MTQTVGLRIKLGLVELFKAIPGVSNAYLNRPQPVGENETQDGAVINVFEEATQANADNQITLPLTMQIRVSIYVPVVVGEDPVDVVVDPLLRAVNTTMHGAARSLPGVQGISLVQLQPEAEGDAGRLDLFWNIIYRTYQLDLTTPSP